jgi:small subunit ribosomal protein S10
MKNIAMLKLELKTVNKKILTIYINFLTKFFKNYNINFSKISLPTKRSKFTLLKSPHVYKKAREQFEFINYKQVFYIYNSENKNLLKFLLYNKPAEIKSLIKIIN